MNKKGAVYLSVIIGLFIYVTGILFIPFMMDDITTFRANMDCTNSSITNGEKISCLVVDSVIPYFIWLVVSMALGFIINAKI